MNAWHNRVIAQADASQKGAALQAGRGRAEGRNEVREVQLAAIGWSMLGQKDKTPQRACWCSLASTTGTRSCCNCPRVSRTSQTWLILRQAPHSTPLSPATVAPLAGQPSSKLHPVRRLPPASTQCRCTTCMREEEGMLAIFSGPACCCCACLACTQPPAGRAQESASAIHHHNACVLPTAVAHACCTSRGATHRQMSAVSFQASIKVCPPLGSSCIRRRGEYTLVWHSRAHSSLRYTLSSFGGAAIGQPC